MVLKYQQPFAQTDQATDGWGSWADGRTQAHRGVDYQPGADASIPAVATGSVSYNDWNSALGNVLVIAHPDGMYSGYSHMRDFSPHAPGTAITRGQHVGYVGSTGTASRAPHLHLTITYTPDGTWNNSDISVTVDPFDFINRHLDGDDPNPPQEEVDDMAAGTLIKRQGSGAVYWQESPSTPLYTLNSGQFAAYQNQGLKLNDLTPANFDGIYQRVGIYLLDGQSRKRKAATSTERQYEGWALDLPDKPL